MDSPIGRKSVKKTWVPQNQRVVYEAVRAKSNKLMADKRMHENAYPADCSGQAFKDLQDRQFNSFLFAAITDIKEYLAAEHRNTDGTQTPTTPSRSRSTSPEPT